MITTYHHSNSISSFKLSNPGLDDKSNVISILTGIIIAIAFLCGGYYSWIGLIAITLLIKYETNFVLNEEILAIRGLGIQLTTTRGFILNCHQHQFIFPLSTSSLFLPEDSIVDVVINEGISGWKIIYYLMIIQDEKHEGIKLRIGFPELLPRLAPLREVWEGIRRVLFDEERTPEEEQQEEEELSLLHNDTFG